MNGTNTADRCPHPSPLLSSVPSCIVNGRIQRTTFPRLFQQDFKIWVQSICLFMQDLGGRGEIPLQASAVFCWWAGWWGICAASFRIRALASWMLRCRAQDVPWFFPVRSSRLSVALETTVIMEVTPWIPGLDLKWHVPKANVLGFCHHSLPLRMGIGNSSPGG